MFLIELILITLLNETFAYAQNDTETVILPARKLTGEKKISLTLKAFEKQIKLKLYRNDQTTSPAYKTWKQDVKDELSHLKTSEFCYYHHNDNISSPVINFCQNNIWEGLIFLEDETLEIRSLRDDFASSTLTDNFCVKKETNISFGKLYHIKRSLQLFANSSFYNINLNNFKQKRQVENTQKKLTIELGIFFDEAAYRTFMPIVDEDKDNLRNMILAYVNNIEATFHHPSLGVPIDISLVYLEIMEKQPSEMPPSNNTIQLFISFCEYAHSRNTMNDNDQHHWDVALYLTGLNTYKLFEKGRKDYSLLGLSSLNSVCDMSNNYSCSVVEFGPNNTLASGFASSFIAAHEIAHVLGIPHDDVNPCKTLDHIMATRRFRQAQLTWSQCSRNVAEHLWDEKECLRDRTTPVNATDLAYNHSQYNHLPGRIWNAKAQCEIYYRDKDANVVSLVDICQTLQCETSTQNNFTGPALEGTRCAHEQECQGGKCLPIQKPEYSLSNYDELYFYKTDWSEWKTDSCKSSCLNKSKGVVVKRRSCTRRGYKTAHCKGLYYDVDLCDDSLLCANKSRLTIFKYIKKRCNDFKLQNNMSNKFQPLKQSKYQGSYIKEETWTACAVFCIMHKNSGGDFFYSGLDMRSVDFNPFFPDGTWCHQQNGQNYYCRQHYCLPENYSFNSQEE